MTCLSDKMRALADAGHAQALELRTSATDLDNAEMRANLNPSKERYETLIRVWSEARNLWCDCAGKERFLS